ncbi:hypothetical protein G9A89_015511 [Geosiphon pyriformis]|nr:hypothetical protein G9A89_015511 [Geosiphon pyriformis]
MENEIQRLPRIGEQTFKKLPSPPTKGSDEVKQHQPFCKKVVDETVKCLSLKDLLVLGDTSYRKEDEVYPDIIIGLNQYYSQLTNNPPDLSKGLGWEVKNDIIDQRKGKTGKGQIVKYASIYLTANVPLTSVFYGCLTDGNHWQFMKVTINEARNKLAMGESQLYIWNTQTASLIAGLINHYYGEYLMKASGEKKDSPNNDKAYMFLKLSLTPESLLASFIKKGFIIKLDSGNDIHVQVISHLGTGKESLVFLVQVLDYGIKEAVLKIEVRKNSEFSQIYQEISALHALSNLSCVPKILFEGHTMGGFQAIITDFVGQPLESWISDNGDINDYTLFQIILDLWSCLKQIHSNCYAHGDVAIRNIIRRNERFYFIDFGLATMLQLRFDSCQAIIQDYIELCQIIAIIKVGRKMSLLELIDKLEGGLKQFVASVEDASRWKITDEEKWLEKFGAEVQQFHKDYHLPENTLEI